MVELIITEKPAQAEKIATALADTKPTKKGHIMHTIMFLNRSVLSGDLNRE